MNILEIKNITKTYKNTGICALKDISFNVTKGQVYGLIGPDGAGKTTLFRLIVTLLLQDRGTINFMEKDSIANISYFRKYIGYMPQRFSLYQDLTVEENLNFFAQLYGVSEAEKKKRLTRLFEFSRLKPFIKRKAGELSGGMKQKLALSCVLIHQPELIILDEPTVGVDPVSRNEFWKIIAELAKENTTILVSTCYMDEALNCSKIGLIYEGTLLADDTPANLINNYKYPLYFLKSEDTYQTYKNLKQTIYKDEIQIFGSGIHLHDKKQEGITKITDKLIKYEIQEIDEIKPQFEDIFLEILNKK